MEFLSGVRETVKLRRGLDAKDGEVEVKREVLGRTCSGRAGVLRRNVPLQGDDLQEIDRCNELND